MTCSGSQTGPKMLAGKEVPYLRQELRFGRRHPKEKCIDDAGGADAGSMSVEGKGKGNVHPKKE